MTIAINANVGKTITLAIETKDQTGERSDGYADGYSVPIVDWIRLPSGSNAAGFPAAMTQIATGVYIYSLTLPSGASSVGSYIASVTWEDPAFPEVQLSELFIIHASLPFGISSISPA